MNTEDQPITPDSLAAKYVNEHPDVVFHLWKEYTIPFFLAGYQASAERNATVAQARDLAEEALRRHGFELSTAGDVVTWVPPAERKSSLMRGNHIMAMQVENAALKTAAADYAKAAEASAALVEKLTRDRDAALNEHSGENPHYMSVAKAYWNTVLGDLTTLRAELSAAREQLRKGAYKWDELVANYKTHSVLAKHDIDGLRKKLSAANAARDRTERDLVRQGELLTRVRQRRDKFLRYFVRTRNERDSLKAALEKARDDWQSQVNEIRGTLEKERASNTCDVCGGTGEPVSKRMCACGGSGKMSDCAIALREALYDSDRRLLLAEEAAKKGEEARLNAGALEEGVKELRRQLAEANGRASELVRLVDFDTKEIKKLATQLTEWQVVAGKKDAALSRCTDQLDALHCASVVDGRITDRQWLMAREARRAGLFALQPDPPTSLLDELERAFLSGAKAWRERADDAETARSLWLASETRRRFCGEVQP